MRKKILLTLGTMTTAVTPIAAIVSCGVEQAGKMAWDDGGKLVQFDLNTDQAKAPFTAYIKADLSDFGKNIKAIVADFENIITQGNATPLKGGEEITVEFMFQYEGKQPAKDANALNTAGAPTLKTSVKFKFVYQTLNTDKDKPDSVFTKAPIGFKTNFGPALIKGLLATGLFKVPDASVKTDKLAELAQFFYNPDGDDKHIKEDPKSTTPITYIDSQFVLVSKAKADVINAIADMKKDGYKIPMVEVPKV